MSELTDRLVEAAARAQWDADPLGRESWDELCASANPTNRSLAEQYRRDAKVGVAAVLPILADAVDAEALRVLGADAGSRYAAKRHIAALIREATP